MLLAGEPDLCVLGEAADGASALDLAVRLQPDIVLLDVDMPRLDGITTARSLRWICPQAGIIILSIHDDAGIRENAAEAGAAAFVAKSMPATTLLTAIRQVALQPKNGLTPPILSLQA